MYGTQAAAALWSDTWAEKLEEANFYTEEACCGMFFLWHIRVTEDVASSKWMRLCGERFTKAEFGELLMKIEVRPDRVSGDIVLWFAVMIFQLHTFVKIYPS